MLHVFRKHQKWLYIFITAIICISFSFFGVINSISGPETPDPVAFTSINGKAVKRSELEQMAYFIGTDEFDKLAFGGIWGPNFLNDGVIQRDFLATGLANEVGAAFQQVIQPDLEGRSSKESKYTLYAHPEAKFINVANAWNYLAPEMKEYFATLQSTQDPLSDEAFKARVQLYLAQRKLPPYMLKQVLKYQQKQYSWIPKDPNLDYIDLSIFGYHTLDDWFGPQFVRVAAALIIDVAELAQSQGVYVSEDEALASLIKNAHRSFEQNKNSPRMNVVNANEYLQEQLRRMRMDIHQAVAIWKQVLLFRRYFQEYGDTLIVDRLPYDSFAQYANEYVAGDLYQLPEELRLGHFRDLQQYEYYIRAVAAQENNEDPLGIPKSYLSSEEIAKAHPEFVQRRYRLKMASVDAKTLEDEVGTKKLWNWEISDKNWPTLESQFAELGVAAAQNETERFKVLESLSPITREKVDQFSRRKMTEEHPEWIDNGLEGADTQVMVVGIRRGGDNTPFQGIRGASELSALLDYALSGDQKSKEALLRYSEDGRHFYRIEVLEEAPEDDVLTFAELKQDGTLDDALRKDLEAHYQEIREQDANKYQTANGDWKSFNEVRDLVARDYFSDVLLAINERVESDDPLTVDDAARFRFSKWMEHVKHEVEKNPDDDTWVRTKNSDRHDGDLLPRLGLPEQWKLVKSSYRLTLGGERDERIDRAKAFALEKGQWSGLYVPPQGDITFFRLVDKGIAENDKFLEEGMARAHQSLSNSAQQALMRKTLKEIAEKQPIEFQES